LHLFGHMHEGGLTSVAHGGGNARRTFQSCSLFGLEHWGEKNATRQHGYALGEIRSENSELRLRIWPRVATPKTGGGRQLVRDSSFTLVEDDGGTEPVVVRHLSAQCVVAASHTVTPSPLPKPTGQYDPRNPPFYVPYRQKGAQVIGREDSLVKVRQQLTAGRRTAIGQTAVFQGLGGLGKTQLAVEYAYRYRHDYPNGVIWLTADQDIDAQLVDLSVKARWAAPESEHSFKLEIARHRLRSYTDCLIVFDNLEQMADIQNYLPEPPAEPHILVTSRTEQPDFTYVPINVLNSAQSLQLLIQEAGREPKSAVEQEAAQAIADTLGGLPLALELAGAYLLRRQLSWSDYLLLLQRNLKDALPQRFSSMTKHEADIYSTLRITEEVFVEEPRLREILDVLTWSAPAPMGLDLLTSLLGAGDRTELMGALGLGKALRILQQTPGTDSYAVHRLVRQVRREETPLADQSVWAAGLCVQIANWFESLRQDFLQLSRFEAEIDHLVEWHKHSLSIASQQSCRLTWLQAYPPFHRVQPQGIKRLIELALIEYQQHGCDDQALLAHLYSDLAYSIGVLGNPKLALELDEQALVIRRELFGENHPDTARSLSNIAGYHGDLGNLKRALELGEQALVIQRKLFGENHPDTAISLGNIAGYHGDIGNWKRALELGEKALVIRREQFGENHPDTATSLNNVASYYYGLGNSQRALELGEQAFVIRRELFGENHPDTASSLGNIASYHYDLGNSKRALELGEQALVIRRELFGERHPDTAHSLSNIADYHRTLGNPKNALELAEQALAIQLKLWGEHHPDTANSLHKTASFLKQLGKFQQAYERAMSAFEIRKKVFGADHPATLNTHALLRKIPGFRAPSLQGAGHGKKKRK